MATSPTWNSGYGGGPLHIVKVDFGPTFEEEGRKMTSVTIGFSVDKSDEPSLE
jgi:hypothetical protein